MAEYKKAPYKKRKVYGPTRADMPVVRSRTITLGRDGRIPAYLLPRSLKPEVKRQFAAASWDAETLDDPAHTPSRFGFFVNIAQGVGGDGRVGDQVNVKRLLIRGHVRANTTSTYNQTVLCLIKDTEPAAGVPAWTDVFQGIGAASLDSYMNPILNFDKRFRFRIVKLKRYGLGWKSAVQAVGGGSILNSPQIVPFVFNIPMNQSVKFDGTGAVTNGCEYYLFGWSTQNTNTPVAYMGYQTYFTDA